MLASPELFNLQRAWLASRSVVIGEGPPAREAAEVLVALRDVTGAILGVPAMEAASAFLGAAHSVDIAVSHLLNLRRLIADHPVDGVHADGVEAIIIFVARQALVAAERLALVEPLTSLGNRRAFERDLLAETSRAVRTNDPLALIYFDLDGLKLINDSDGHFAGDAALRDFAIALKVSLRTSDRSYRVGGDEFVALLSPSGPSSAERFVERLRARRPPKFSFGIAVCPADTTEPARLLALADHRLLAQRAEERGIIQLE